MEEGQFDRWREPAKTDIAASSAPKAPSTVFVPAQLIELSADQAPRPAETGAKRTSQMQALPYGVFTTRRLRVRAMILVARNRTSAEADFRSALALAREQRSPTPCLLAAPDFVNFLAARRCAR